MQKSTAVLVGLLALAMGGALGYQVPRYFNQTATAPAATPAPVPATRQKIAVEVAPARATLFERGINAVGSLNSNESVRLRPEVAGRVHNIHFHEGQRVQKGQVLISLDDSIPRAEFEQARANLALAESNFKRSLELQEKGFISKQAKDEVDNALKVQRANMQLAQAKLEKSVIRAPFSGVIGLRDVSAGDYVSVGQDLVSLEAVNPLKVDFRVPETYSTAVKPGQPLELTLDALPNQRFQGKVTAISPVVDAGGRSLVLRAEVGNDAYTLRPGMFARVRLLTGQKEETLLVPETAVTPVGEEFFVYVVEEGRARRVRVELGLRQASQVEVISGIKAGDQVVVAGLQKVRDGAEVQVLNANQSES